MPLKLKTLTTMAVLAITTATAGATIAGELKNSSPAPEFTGIEKWLNSDPLTIQQLRGKVVPVDFWTYTCSNCINTLPYVKGWHEKYKDQGLVVVGVHTPEFPFERSTDNVKTAIKRFDIRYPVAQDNRYATWSAYENQYWPTFYLIDRTGQVVYTHFGEGQYAQTEAAIKALLAQKG
jgi:thiol-disulfide isomerase/thioredoxin